MLVNIWLQAFTAVYSCRLVLYKERNALLTYLTRVSRNKDKTKIIPGRGKMRKVKESMSRIKGVLSERRIAYKLNRPAAPELWMKPASITRRLWVSCLPTLPSDNCPDIHKCAKRNRHGYRRLSRDGIVALIRSMFLLCVWLQWTNTSSIIPDFNSFSFFFYFRRNAVYVERKISGIRVAYISSVISYRVEFFGYTGHVACVSAVKLFK